MSLEKLQQALPQVKSWVEDYVRKHEIDRVPISKFGFPRLAGIFEPEWLHKTYCVVVDHVETPPLAEFGLGDLSFFQSGGYGGITFGTTYFVSPGQEKNESLHFHELIHTVQWDQLGFESFLKVYGIGLFEHGYRASPFEVIAYDLQDRFDAQEDLGNVPKQVRLHAQTLSDKYR